MNHPKSANGITDSAVLSSTCACGSSKRSGKPFCFECSRALLVATDKTLYTGLFRCGEAFYEAYDLAVEHLKEVGEIREKKKKKE